MRTRRRRSVGPHPSGTRTQRSNAQLRKGPYHFGTGTRSLGPFESSIRAKRKCAPAFRTIQTVQSSCNLQTFQMVCIPAPHPSATDDCICQRDPVLLGFFFSLARAERHHSTTSVGVLPFAHATDHFISQSARVSQTRALKPRLFFPRLFPLSLASCLPPFFFFPLSIGSSKTDDRR